MAVLARVDFFQEQRCGRSCYSSYRRHHNVLQSLLLLASLPLPYCCLCRCLSLQLLLMPYHVPAFHTESQESAVMANHTMAGITSGMLSWAQRLGSRAQVQIV